VNNWANVVAVRINLLARNGEASPGFTDAKTYTLGLDAAGAPITYTPNDAYHRHAYSTLVRVVNVSQRRETP
jgi:type IV pilus assembly protein PilW